MLPIRQTSVFYGNIVYKILQSVVYDVENQISRTLIIRSLGMKPSIEEQGFENFLYREKESVTETENYQYALSLLFHMT